MAVNKVVYGGRTLIDISDTTATADKILSGYTAYGADGNKVTGTAESGGVSPQPTEEKAVFFYDYEGTLLYSYTKAEFLALSAMPANPSHEGLVAQGWNWSLANAKTYIQSYDKLIIGQMYTTSSGDTEIDVSLYEGRIDPYFGLAVKGTVTINWGDGSSSDLTGSSLTVLKKIKHSYSAAGDYTISIHAEGTNEYSIYSNKSGTGHCSLLSSVSSTATSAVTTDSIAGYVKCIKAVRIGSHTSTIGMRAFQKCWYLGYVTIPNTVTTLNSYTNADNTGLKFITIPNSVTELGGYNFDGATNLEHISLPDGLVTLGNYTFRDCTSLEEVALPDTVSDIGTYAFHNCETLRSVKIPSTVTALKTYTFGGCTALTKLTLPDTITEIGQNAFTRCGFSELALPKYITAIADYTFYDCASLTSVAIPASVVSIGSQVFHQCTKLETVTFEGGVESIGDESFINCTSLRSINIPSTITSLGNNIFRGCSSLKTANILCDLTEIPSGLFYDCSRLENVSIPNTVTTINQNAFRECEFIESIDIPANVTSIGANTFSGTLHSLSVIKFYGTTPPTIGSSCFTGLRPPCTIYVPAGTLSAYTGTTNMPKSTTYTYVEY